MNKIKKFLKNNRTELICTAGGIVIGAVCYTRVCWAFGFTMMKADMYDDETGDWYLKGPFGQSYVSHEC